VLFAALSGFLSFQDGALRQSATLARDDCLACIIQSAAIRV